MKKYDNYKDSGVEWIGKIPEHWDRIRIKSLVAIKVTDGPHETPQWIENGVPFISAEAIKGNKIDLDFKRGYISTEQHLEYCKKSKVLKNDILFCKSGSTTGKSALVDTDVDFGIWSPLAIIRADKNKIDYKYLFQSIQSSLFQNQVETAWTFGTQPNIGMGALENLWIAIPTLEEQQSIANYLDHKTTQIDTLIAKKEQFISLLQEERTAVINQAVTKGLDPKVKMKDSGIEWLGEIPEHWEVAKFNLYVSIRHGHQFMNHDFTDDGVKVVKITQLHKDGYLDLSKCSYVSSEQLENYQSILIKEKDILMCLTGGTIGKIIRVGEVNEPLLQNYRVGHFSSGKASKISDDFIFWLMSSESIVSQIFFQMRETGQPNIGMDDFGRMRITIPPLMEQEKIVKHIVNKTVEISEILIKSKQEIELLKEYKTALISEVVTGKVDVRDVILN